MQHEKNCWNFLGKVQIIKLESNFLRDYDEVGYPSDIFEPMEDLFHTQSQVDKFIKTMEGATYRLKQ